MGKCLLCQKLSFFFFFLFLVFSIDRLGKFSSLFPSEHCYDEEYTQIKSIY